MSLSSPNNGLVSLIAQLPFDVTRCDLVQCFSSGVNHVYLDVGADKPDLTMNDQLDLLSRTIREIRALVYDLLPELLIPCPSILAVPPRGYLGNGALLHLPDTWLLRWQYNSDAIGLVSRFLKLNGAGSSIYGTIGNHTPINNVNEIVRSTSGILFDEVSFQKEGTDFKRLRRQVIREAHPDYPPDSWQRPFLSTLAGLERCETNEIFATAARIMNSGHDGVILSAQSVAEICRISQVLSSCFKIPTQRSVNESEHT